MTAACTLEARPQRETLKETEQGEPRGRCQRKWEEKGEEKRVRTAKKMAAASW
jgi:hypothetical protein